MQPASAIALPGSPNAPLRVGGAAATAAVRFAPALEAVERLAPEWQALAQDAAEPNPFVEHWFVAASVRHLGRPDLRVAEVRDSGRLIGVMPLSIEPRYGRVPVAHVQNWRHHHLFLGAPLVQVGEEQAFWIALIRGLDAAHWAPGFLHLRDLDEEGATYQGLTAAVRQLGRPLAVVHREARAFLKSDLGPQEYYENAVRKKKRKEQGRLANRLNELGRVTHHVIDAGAGPVEIGAWIDAFLELERAGWKGAAGSALACQPETAAFLREVVQGAAAAGRLQMRRIDLDERPIAILISFLTPPGSFSFKTAFAEDMSRFSPGVMIQVDNLQILDCPNVAWMDSCAVEDHPMIDSIWRERRQVVRVSLPLKGVRRALTYRVARTLEQASAARRRLASPKTAPPGEQE